VASRWRPGLRSAARAGVALVVVAALGGCSRDVEPRGSLTVVGTEMRFDAPDRAPAGHHRVTFRNDGALNHELALRDPQGRIVVRRSIGGHQQATLEVDLQPGTWELGCFEPGHYQAGMHRPLVGDPA